MNIHRDDQALGPPGVASEEKLAASCTRLSNRSVAAYFLDSIQRYFVSEVSNSQRNARIRDGFKTDADFPFILQRTLDLAAPGRDFPPWKGWKGGRSAEWSDFGARSEITMAGSVFGPQRPITKCFPRAVIRTSPRTRGGPGRNPCFARAYGRAGNYGVILFLHALRVNLYQAQGTRCNKVSPFLLEFSLVFRACRKSAPRTLWIARLPARYGHSSFALKKLRLVLSFPVRVGAPLSFSLTRSLFLCLAWFACQG